MDQLIEYFIKYATSDKIWTAFIALGIYYILKKEPFKVFEYISQKREREHALARELLESGKLSKETNEFLRERLEYFAFKRYYGISTDPEMRCALIKFQKKHQRNLKWSQIRRAYPNINLNDGKIEVDLPLKDHVLRWLVTILCWLVGIYATIVIALAIYGVSELSTLQFFGLTTAALILLLTAMLFSSLNWPYHDAKKILLLTKK